MNFKSFVGLMILLLISNADCCGKSRGRGKSRGGGFKFFSGSSSSSKPSSSHGSSSGASGSHGSSVSSGASNRHRSSGSYGSFGSSGYDGSIRRSYGSLGSHGSSGYSDLSSNYKPPSLHDISNPSLSSGSFGSSLNTGTYENILKPSYVANHANDQKSTFPSYNLFYWIHARHSHGSSGTGSSSSSASTLQSSADSSKHESYKSPSNHIPSKNELDFFKKSKVMTTTSETPSSTTSNSLTSSTTEEIVPDTFRIFKLIDSFQRTDNFDDMIELILKPKFLRIPDHNLPDDS